MRNTLAIWCGTVCCITIIIVSSIHVLYHKNVKYTEETYTVCAGETLWSIAEKYAEGDLRKWIYEVEKINGITAEIYQGDEITILISK